MYPPCRRWANSTAPKLLDYGYVQCDMQLWSLQGTPLYSAVQWKNPQFLLFPASACLIARALDVIQGLEV